MPQNEVPVLRVEGKDDKFAITNLLERHGVDHALVDIKWLEQQDDLASGKDALLEGMRTAVATSTGRSVGFVLDADRDLVASWQAVRTRLIDVGLALPDEIPEGGFVGNAETYRARVGVWLMPDNRRLGTLEAFLIDLINEEDRLLPLAETSTTRASERGATFAETRRQKAVLHTWLAWQERPGVPYGVAIAARYFRHESPAATAFVDWFRRVFEDTGS